MIEQPGFSTFVADYVIIQCLPFEISVVDSTAWSYQQPVNPFWPHRPDNACISSSAVTVRGQCMHPSLLFWVQDRSRTVSSRIFLHGSACDLRCRSYPASGLACSRAGRPQTSTQAEGRRKPQTFMPSQSNMGPRPGAPISRMSHA